MRKKRYHSQREKALWKLAACALVILLLAGIGGLRLTPIAALRTAEEIVGCGETKVLWRQNEWMAGRVRMLSANENAVLVTDAVLDHGGWNPEGRAVLDCPAEEPFCLRSAFVNGWRSRDWFLFGRINVPGAVHLHLKTENSEHMDIPQSRWLKGNDGSYCFYWEGPNRQIDLLYVQLLDASGEVLYETTWQYGT